MALQPVHGPCLTLAAAGSSGALQRRTQPFSHLDRVRLVFEDDQVLGLDRYKPANA